MSHTEPSMTIRPAATTAVPTVATQGTSWRLRRARTAGSSPSSASWDSVRVAPASGARVPWNMLSIMNQIAVARAPWPKSGAKVGPRLFCNSPSIPRGPSTPSHTTGSTRK